MPDILPVSLQDFLYCWEPELRKGKIDLAACLDLEQIMDENGIAE